MWMGGVGVVVKEALLHDSSGGGGLEPVIGLGSLTEQ